MNVLDLRSLSSLLLLIPLGIVLGTFMLFVFMTVRWARQRRLTPIPGNLKQSFVPSRNYRLAFLNQPSKWLAIKGNNPLIVQAALGLNQTTPCSWEEGLVEAREHKLFVSPAISGWVLVFGSELPDPSEDVDKCFHFLSALSRKVGHVQFFSTNRAVNHHCWSLFDQGRVFRAYAWAGETIWNQGPMTAAEREFGMRCFDYATERLTFSQKEAVSLNVEKLGRLASRWSIDPGSIPDSIWNASHGIVGHFSQSKLH